MASRVDELNLFLRDSLSRGISRAEIESALTEAGWHTVQIKKALSAYADVPFPFPVPRPVHQLSAAQAFLYLVLFAALGTSAFSLAELFFNLIEFVFYDPAHAPTVFRELWLAGMRWAVARAVIAFPVFLFASWWTARALRREPAERSSPIRRWLTYAAMFVAVCVIIGDFVTLVAYVLSGETTIRFVLKVAVVAVLAGVILGYYLWDLRENAWEKAANISYALLALATVAAVFAVGSGLFMMGAPSEQAAMRIDDHRVGDLKAIKGSVDVYLQRRGRLPESLQEIAAEFGSSLTTQDPENGTAYEYHPGEGKKFELCATFARVSQSIVIDTTWTHGAGRQCFSLEAEEEKAS
jgi:hypothetical protein